jgi:hypothetical protein
MTARQFTDQYIALPPEARHQAEDFISYLRQKYAPTSSPASRGTPGRELLQFAGTIEPDDLALMKQAIEEGCEKVDANEW